MLNFLPSGDEIRQRRTFGEPFDAEIRRMDAQDQRGAFADRRRIVCAARLVRRAHLAQDRARLRHDVRDAEAAADLDQLAARHDHLASRRQRRQHEHRRRRVVVDDDRGFGAGQPAQQRLGVDVAPAARAARRGRIRATSSRARPRRRARWPRRPAARGRDWCG